MLFLTLLRSIDVLRAVCIAGPIMLAVFAWHAPARAFDWNRNTVAYTWATAFREPANPQKIEKHILTLTHSDGWMYGTNFINVALLFSNNSDRRAGSGSGAREIYVVDRHDLDLKKIGFGDWTYGPFKAVTVVVGGDINSKNNSFGSEKRMPVAGMAFTLDVPGYWKVALLWSKEWNRNGIVGRKVTFESTYRVETAWDIPFTLAAQNFTFEGYANFTGVKGRDGFGVPTAPELLANASVMYDVGKMIGHGDSFRIGLGYEYWLNKFGNNHHNVTGAVASTFLVRAAYRFAL